ncbi:hypothetical protein [Nakamurella endophytica]|uniref:Lipoprotein n=1 Tax=Nakamurella endophytica TaxID=1748367 RepID=A0A917W9X1_9ACTN|nr:hypothetical protein [Nakamurella endophytica]GGL86340.1 hypothetical protein GCM10011594_02440 [Nakamurella endophytica]
MSSTDRRPLRLRLVSMAAAGALVVPSLAACSSNQGDQRAYCVNAQNQVVDDSYCDQGHNYGGGLFFLLLASGAFNRGAYIPSGAYYGSRINPADRTARVNAGLPATGRAAGTTIRSGGIGKGSGGGSSHHGTGS